MCVIESTKFIQIKNLFYRNYMHSFEKALLIHLKQVHDHDFFKIPVIRNIISFMQAIAVLYNIYFEL